MEYPMTSREVWQARFAFACMVLLLGVLLATVPGCDPAGKTINLAAGQSTYAEFDKDGNLIIQGDGTADFDVEASGNEVDGWLLKIKTKTVRETIGGAAAIAADNNATARRGMETIDNLAALAAPIIAARSRSDAETEEPTTDDGGGP